MHSKRVVKKNCKFNSNRLLIPISPSPLIKDVPCPTCLRIIPIRVYEKPTEAESS